MESIVSLWHVIIGWAVWPWLLAFLLAAVLFSLAVFIHELGHFAAARLLGLRADVFSIGFGPALWKRTFRGTEVRLSAIPFGGYVSLPQLDPSGMQRIQGDHGEEALPPAAPWKRVVVAFAGPFGNLALAFLCAVAIAWFAPAGATGATTTLGIVPNGSAAAQAGLRTGDRLLAVNGNTVRSWSDIQTECFLSGGTNDCVTLTYERAGATYETQAILDTQLTPTEKLYTVGGLIPDSVHLGIGEVVPDSPAAQAGLKAGDAILSVDGKPFTDPLLLTQRADPAAPVTLVVRSGAGQEPRSVVLTPGRLPPLEGEAGEPPPRIGVVLNLVGQGHFQWMTERGVWAQLRADTMGVVRVLKALTLPEAEGETKRAANGLGGPIMIFSIFMQVIQYGLWASLGFLRLICVNLALLNLLPLPVLDGGHIVFALYAMIRRKEAPTRVIDWLTNAFVFLLFGLLILLVFKDSFRLLHGFFAG